MNTTPGSGAAIDFTDARSKHLDMIQGTVCQLRGASAATRRYGLMLAAVTFLATLLMNQHVFLLLMIGLTIVFWALDAGYLDRKRSYEALYDEVRREPPDRRPDFRMAPPIPARGRWHAAVILFKGPQAFVYLAMIMLLVAAGLSL